MLLAFKRWNSQSTSASAQKILLLHGMGGTGAIWRPLAASLEEDCDILAPDQRGHGGSLISQAPGGRERVSYTPLDYGRDLVETLERENFHPAWVIGHSMGVRSACALAHLKTDWVRGMILVDLGFSGPAGGGLGEDLASFLQILPMHFGSRAEARAFMEAHCPDPAIGQYLLAVSVPDQTQGITFPFDRAALIETIHAARDVSVREWIKEAGSRGMPVLVLRGAESLVWSHEEFESERRALAPYPSIRFEEMEGTGHGLPFEKRLAFAARVREFAGNRLDGQQKQ
jgi:pimeloyl-ACP methyl ester carboxylesterase